MIFLLVHEYTSKTGMKAVVPRTALRIELWSRKFAKREVRHIKQQLSDSLERRAIVIGGSMLALRVALRVLREILPGLDI
jgi:hypothetical protein